MIVKDIAELTPAARKKFNDFLWEARRRLKPLGLDIFLTETYRPQSRQDELYKIGRRGIADEKIVTQLRRSKHTSRRAWDVAFKGLEEKVDIYLRGWPKGCTEAEQIKRQAEAWAILGAVAKHFNIIWGGTWIKLQDKPHFEIPR
jgi:hypothetical protein